MSCSILPQVALYSHDRLTRPNFDAQTEAIADDEALPFWNLMRPTRSWIAVIGGDGPAEPQARADVRNVPAVRVDWGVSLQLA